jgi:hypothetical protein
MRYKQASRAQPISNDRQYAVGACGNADHPRFPSGPSGLLCRERKNTCRRNSAQDAYIRVERPNTAIPTENRRLVTVWHRTPKGKTGQPCRRVSLPSLSANRTEPRESSLHATGFALASGLFHSTRHGDVPCQPLNCAAAH